MKDALSYEALVKALFENYESIYDIDAETGKYQCYYESELYKELMISESGEDFFAALKVNVPKVIYQEDREYVLKMLRKNNLLSAIENERYHSFVYRLLIDGKPVYHKARATMESIRGRPHILIGVRNVDETIRQERVHMDALASMQQKEKNHLAAILGSAAGYMEINLTKDIILERSPDLLSDVLGAEGTVFEENEIARYSCWNQWVLEHHVTENKEKYEQVNDRDYLLHCFSLGEKRASVSFSLRKQTGEECPYREIIYLYQDDASGDIMAFSVIYDLTEQQRKEKEVQELEAALQMSRIRNFTSQMQPHFLYNALGSIQEILLYDPQYASDLIGDFTTHLRSCIRAMASDTPLPFSQELDNIKAYVNIEKMRFGDRLNVRYEIEAEGFSILPLSIQPLVENAIRHGVYGRGLKGGTVIVRSREADTAWVVEVEDDGVGFDVEAFRKELEEGKKDSTGLKNITFRLENVMNSHIDVTSIVGVGTTVTVSIPKGE